MTAQPDPVTYEQAMADAARLLRFAEDDLSNLPRMKALTELGHAWIDMAGLIFERERT